MIFKQWIRHLYRGTVYETDVWIGPTAKWADWPESHSDEWQALRYRQLTVALRPVAAHAGSHPVAAGAIPIGKGRRYRMRHEVDGRSCCTEVVFRNPDEDPPLSRDPAAWHRIDFGPTVVFICPIVHDHGPHADDPRTLGRDVGAPGSIGLPWIP